MQTFFSFRELMTELFPTLGYPMKPMLMFFLSLWKLSNYKDNDVIWLVIGYIVYLKEGSIPASKSESKDLFQRGC